MENIFLYCPESANREAVIYFNAKGYQPRELSDNDSFFWETVNSVDNNGILVLYSHGDSNGPLRVKGHGSDPGTAAFNEESWDDDKIARFGGLLEGKNVTLILLSCHTGSGEFYDKLKQYFPDGGSRYLVAPKGYASIKSSNVSTGINSIKSENNTESAGWSYSGTREKRTLDIPNCANKNKRRKIK